MSDEKSGVVREVENSSPTVVQNSTIFSHLKVSSFQIIFSLSITWTAFICNFDLAFGGVVLLMTPFKEAFGTCKTVPGPHGSIQKCSLTATQQSLTSLTSIFVGVGAAISGFIADYLGRRGTIQIGCLITTIGAAGMLGSADTYAGYLVCKSIGGVGIGLLYAIGPVYGVESAPPRMRGFLVSLYGLGHALGDVTGTAICLGSSSIPNYWAWRTPIICQIPVAIACAIGLFAFPESPRWLLTKGKEEAARVAFGRFYGKHPHSNEITVQVIDVQANIELENSRLSTASWIQIFRRPSLRRTLTAALILYGHAITGIAFVGPYAALFLAAVGISNAYLVRVIVALCTFAGGFPGPFIVEYAGRRRALLLGYIGMGSCMMIFAITGSALGQSNSRSKDVLTAFLCIWGFLIGAFVQPAVFVSSSEMHSVTLRARGQAFATMIYQIFLFGSSFWTPYMLNVKYGNMGTNVGYFYGGLTILQIGLLFVFLPETGRLTLEQIDVYFASGRRPWKTSIARNKKIANGEDSEVVYDNGKV